MDEETEKVRSFITRSVRARELGDEDDIFALGLVNSMFAMQLVLFVEREFQVSVENADLDIANFRSVSAICELVRRKRGAHEPLPAV